MVTAAALAKENIMAAKAADWSPGQETLKV